MAEDSRNNLLPLILYIARQKLKLCTKLHFFRLNIYCIFLNTFRVVMKSRFADFIHSKLYSNGGSNLYKAITNNVRLPWTNMFKSRVGRY